VSQNQRSFIISKLNTSVRYREPQIKLLTKKAAPHGFALVPDTNPGQGKLLEYQPLTRELLESVGAAD